MASPQIDNQIYNSLGQKWYTAKNDPVALLRAESRLRNPWVLAQIASDFGNAPATVLDVACGGGFLSNALALAGHRVSGIDLSDESLAVARSRDTTQTVNYVPADAYALPFATNSFDVVCAMDFLEHVENPAAAIAEMSRVLKPGGLFFFHTFNRNWLSRIVAIKLVEWLVANTPKHLHLHRMFITPEELAGYCEAAALDVEELRGVKPCFGNRDLVGALLRREVPDSFAFRFTSSLRVGYTGYARSQKPRSPEKGIQ